MIRREGIRALCVFGLYLTLYPAWKIMRGHDLYESIIVMIANAVILSTQHFPIYSSIETLRMQYLDFLPVLVVSSFLASTRVAWSTRIRRYGALLLVILFLHVVGFILETKIDTADQLLREQGLVLLLPWELRITDGFKYLLVDFGLNIGPFLVLVLTFAWNVGVGVFAPAELATRGRETGRDASRRDSKKNPGVNPWTRARAVVAAFLMVGAGAASWKMLRESDPLHVQTHAQLGHLFLRDGQWAKAEDQYAIALDNHTTDGQAWLNAALIKAKGGHTSEAVRLLERGLEVVDDRDWKQRLQDTRQRLLSGG